MHTPIATLLILWSLAACSKPAVAWPDDASGPMQAPPEVIRLAEPLFVQPFHMGQEYRRKNAARLDEVMRGFGYEPKTVDGENIVGFEISALQPSGTSDDSWWLSHMADIQLPWPKAEPGFRPGQSMQVRATGYLSSPGHYGHLSFYQRDFLAMTMVPLGK